jgi:hypothetical protein
MTTHGGPQIGEVVKIEMGQIVCAVDGEKLGDVTRVDGDSFAVSLDPRAPSLRCDFGDVADVRNGGIWLVRTAAELRSRDCRGSR